MYALYIFHLFASNQLLIISQLMYAVIFDIITFKFKGWKTWGLYRGEILH